MNRDVKLLLKDRDTAFRSGNNELYNTARSNLKKGIKEAKAAYGRKIEGHFSEGDPRRLWQGIQHLTSYKGKKDPSTSTSSAPLAEELNHFFARFEVTEAETGPAPPPTSTNDLALTVSTEDVRRVFRGVNPI